MACYISFRDVQFTPTLYGVKITVTTDIPSHLWCRLSLKPPWLHKKTSYRRGLALVDDIRFCFTVYEDNEQIEPGDTLIHTFEKKNWPKCVTKYMYFWGSIAGEVCKSTSPLFSYHNPGFTMDYPYYAQIDANPWTFWLSRHLPGENYATCRAATIATDVFASATRFSKQDKYAANNFQIDRYPMRFNTSSLPDNAEILAAVLWVQTTWMAAKNRTQILLNTPDLTYPILPAHYGYIFSRFAFEIGRVLKADQTNLQRIHIKVNLAGLHSINRTGDTWWSLVSIDDLNAIAPVTTIEGNYWDPDPPHLIIAYGIPA